MPMILLKSLAGLFAGVAVGSLSLAYWPQIQPAAVGARPVVEQPQQVAQSTPAALDKSAFDKLAQALRDARPSAAPARRPRRRRVRGRRARRRRRRQPTQPTLGPGTAAHRRSAR